MRRLLPFISVVLFLDTLFAAVIAPLLPHYADDLGIGKAAAGVLTGAYPAGTFLAALPTAALVARHGYRRVVVAGLLALAVATVTFAVSNSFEPLVASRALQGAGGGLVWGAGLAWLTRSSPAAQRGAALGGAFAAAVAGSLLGPVVGSLAAAAGPLPVFGTIGLGALVLALWSLRMPAPAAEPVAIRPLRRLANRRVLLGTWLVLLYGGLVGAYTVLAPLHLAALGAGTLGVGAVFALAAAASVAVSPLAGRVSDRRGRIGPMRISLALGAPLIAAQPWAGSPLLLGALVVLASAALTPLWPIGAALLTEGAERVGTAPTVAFAISSIGWGLGELAGAAAGGAAAAVWGDRPVQAVLALSCLGTLAALAAARPRGARVAVPAKR